MDTEDCLACHSDPDFVGEERAINSESFMLTDHANFGCTTCHTSITEDHPGDTQALSTLSCATCHVEVAQEYQETEHSNYASCVDCHDPHNAQALQETASEAMNRPCFQCHDQENLIIKHSEWLPRTKLHVAKVPCITCHTATERFQVVLHINKKTDLNEERPFTTASYSDLKSLSGDKKISELIDTDNNNIVSQLELREFMHDPQFQQMNLSGTLVPFGSSHSLAVQENRYNCTFCHASGPQSTQTSVIAIPTQSGRINRLTVEGSTILDTLYGSPDFYLTGSSRSPALDILGLIVVCCGFIMPVGHGTLRLLTRKNRKH
jgi:predicted CXXCH cytochrome family protein